MIPSCSKLQCTRQGDIEMSVKIPFCNTPAKREEAFVFGIKLFVKRQGRKNNWLYKKKCNSIDHTGYREKGLAAAREPPAARCSSQTQNDAHSPNKVWVMSITSHRNVLIGSSNREEGKKSWQIESHWRLHIFQ